MTGTDELVLQVRDLVVHYGDRRAEPVLRGVDLDVPAGKVVVLVGESGSGKSTLARAALRLLAPTSGTITLLGREVTSLPQQRLRHLRREARMILQDTASSLHPRMTVAQTLAEPLRIHRVGEGATRSARVAAALKSVGLDDTYAGRYGHELSGGQRQRVAIARALILDPRLVVADEAVSALDTTVRAEILRLLVAKQRELGFGCLFITHDISVARAIADVVVTMYRGQVVEQGPAEDVFAAPTHPYTRALIDAAPVPDPRVQRARRQARRAAGLSEPDAGTPPTSPPKEE
jgi:peptide/nickel transport system ATP-binding protein